MTAPVRTHTVRYWTTATTDRRVAVAITDPELARQSLVMYLSPAVAIAWAEQLIEEAHKAMEPNDEGGIPRWMA